MTKASLKSEKNNIFNGPQSKNGLFMELEFRLEKCATVLLRIIVNEVVIYLSFRKIKKQNAFPCKFQKIPKGPLFHCQICVDQKYL